MSEINQDGAYEINVITLTGDDGTEKEFEVLGDLEYEGSVYYALTPYFTGEESAAMLEDPAELIILRAAEENGEEYLEEIEDDDEYEAVADLFAEQLEDLYEIEEEDEE